jgi:hypothetical protein
VRAIKGEKKPRKEEKTKKKSISAGETERERILAPTCA